MEICRRVLPNERFIISIGALEHLMVVGASVWTGGGAKVAGAAVVNVGDMEETHGGIDTVGVKVVRAVV